MAANNYNGLADGGGKMRIGKRAGGLRDFGGGG